MKVGVVGVTGRVGTVLVELLSESGEHSMVGGISGNSRPQELERMVQNSDVLIDFSVPAATLRVAEVADRHRKPLVTGTSLSEDDLGRLTSSCRSIPLLHSCNFSIPIHLMASFLRKCAKILPDFDFSVVEKHHSRKKDAPSSTALFLADQVGPKSQIVSVRSGGLCGDHICDFIGEDEMLTISHRALNRRLFASGALRCARWIIGKSPKLYSLEDFLEDEVNCHG
ncbi:MAG: 4-hydroxy-tetrahydrodipicolinate reductase [Holosporaceae bacterium]|jgi:4-hydroxy-tetrahydrodipicolinate reductase|nr:4-hydroxy-tetrahydrodipicolinate reductase [Holosporaceae bacterium]